MTVDFAKVTIMLADNNIYNSASELHGIICGALSAGAEAEKVHLIWHLLGQSGKPSKILSELIERLALESARQLEDPGFSFQLLLPDDDTELGLRLRALGNWCEGYISGFGGTYAKADASLQDETREVLKDFTAIADLDSGDEEGNERDEKDYMEVMEYVRVAASTVYAQGQLGVKPATSENQEEKNWH
ncbi:MAG: hypothetical protein CMP91_10355 [Gammaproteobacteria bacterium]|nr:hypothetical protein [Gammaproteobacteria bacterium]